MQAGRILNLNDTFTFIVLHFGLRSNSQRFHAREKTTRGKSGFTKLLTRAGKAISSKSLCTGTVVGARAVHTLSVGAAPLGPVGALINICTSGSQRAGSSTAISTPGWQLTAKLTSTAANMVYVSINTQIYY